MYVQPVTRPTSLRCGVLHYMAAYPSGSLADCSHSITESGPKLANYCEHNSSRTLAL